jgi:UDPglucose 6-dehydrogenase
LAKSLAAAGVPSRILDAVEAVNESQKHVLAEKVVARLGEDLSGKVFALWGLAFKPNTDDMREAPSRTVVAELTRRGARVQAYDPVAANEAGKAMAGTEGLAIVDSASAALAGADALVIVTEWREFRTPDFDELARTLKHKLVFDGRNLYEPKAMAAFGIEYHCIGRPSVAAA